MDEYIKNKLEDRVRIVYDDYYNDVDDYVTLAQKDS